MSRDEMLVNAPKVLFALLILTSLSFAYDPSLLTDKYTYAANESIFAVGTVKINTTAISNVSVVFSVVNAAGSSVSSATFITNSTGQFNSTFSLTSAGNYSLRANISGDVVSHFIKVMPYEEMYLGTNRPTYTGGASGTITIALEDINDAGVSGQAVTPTVRYENGTAINTLSPCTTNSLGQCSTNFTAPASDGNYVVEVNGFEESVQLVVGGYDAFMKVSPSIVGKNQNVTVRLVVKNANGNGITASTRQLLLTAPNGTQTTISSMPPANDSSGNTLTGVYENNIAFSTEGTYDVKVTVQPQGSNLTRELKGSFVVSSYMIDVVPWPGSTTLFTPGQTVSLGVRLKNASSNEFMGTTQCGSGSCVTSLSAASVLDSSGVSTGYSPSVSEQTSLGLYRMDISLPAGAKSGTYKVQISLNDSFGTGYGTGYFTVQLAKGTVRALDKFPSGATQITFLSGNRIVLEFSAANTSGVVNVTGVSSYAIYGESGGDKTAIFGTGTLYSGNDNKSYVNLTTPKTGGRYTVRAKLNTLLGSVDVEGWFFVDVLDIQIRPTAIGGGPGGGFTPFGGPGFMFAFRPNDTVQLAVTVTTASETRGFEGFMGGGMAKGGSAGGGHDVGFGGMFGIGGGSNIQGAQVVVDKIININTEEDVTTSTTITNCITANTGVCTLSLKSNVNGQNWTGGFHIVFVNVTTPDNQSDDGEGFFEVRKYLVNVKTKAATAKNATSSGFTTFNDWFIGPQDNLNISIEVIEPGTWQSVSRPGNATILGVYYGGNMGEFVFPPKLQAGTTATANVTNGVASAVVSAPASGWKAGFYIVKALVNISGSVDTGESFVMVKVYQGFGQPVNPTTRQMDFTIGSGENVSIQINVFDVKNNRPAANLTATISKILSFESFPPGEISYDKSLVSTGKTDANGQVVMTLPVPSSGWNTGSYLATFDITNGTVSDTIEGFFQVKNFFVEISGAKWRFATNETISFNATISSDPSWMRQMFGGGCPPGDPMCAGGGGPDVAGGGGGAVNPPSYNWIPYGVGFDLDGDSINDINITKFYDSPTPESKSNLTVAFGANASISDQFWCDSSNTFCPQGSSASISNGFDGLTCEGVTYSNDSSRTHNISGTVLLCVNTTTGKVYKVQSSEAEDASRRISFMQHFSGAIGGIVPIDMSSAVGFSYFNATLKSIKVVKFDFNTGETLMRQNADYNVTSSTGSTRGEGRIVIPGSGSFKLQPLVNWTSGFYRVIAEFNTTPSTADTAESGFSIETFFGNCYRSSWGAVASGDNISIRCDVTDPATSGNYAQRVDMTVESIRNVFTFQNIASGASTWTTGANNTNSTKGTANVLLSQSLPNGQYEATIKLNASSSDTKRQSIWFEVKDFEPSFWSERWSYASSDTVVLRAEGWQNSNPISVNISGGSSPEIAVYRYDKSTWARTAVTGVTINTSVQTEPFTTTYVNLTKSGGWDEGSYEVVANVTKMSGGAATGARVEVRTWFDVRLFDVWGWSELWNNHPKNNITLKIHVGTSGNWQQNYNGVVSANITSITSVQTGAALIQGTDYNATNATANPSVAGDITMVVSPLAAAGLPIGTYRAALQVVDSASGKAATADIWFEVMAFQLTVSTERYEYASTDDITFLLNVYAPSGGNVTLTGGRIMYLERCVASSCATINVANVNTVFNATTNRLTILNTSDLQAGSYSASIQVNDTQNATATNWNGFKITSFGVSGYVQYPSPSRDAYYINETMLLNVTGTIGTNITNATFRYWTCDGSCVENAFVVNIGHVLAAANELVNMTPSVVDGIWPTGSSGSQGYNIDVAAQKGTGTTTFFVSAYVRFRSLWNITLSNNIGPTDNISANVTVYLDYENLQRVSNAIVNVSRVLSSSTWSDLNSTAGAWVGSGGVTNANGVAAVSVVPNSDVFNWTSGSMIVEFTARYGNATAKGQKWVTSSQKTLNVLGKGITNAAGGTIVNATQIVPFNVSISVNNPYATEMVTAVRLDNTALNSSAQVRNLTSLTLTGMNLSSGAATTFSFGLNVTGVTNVTSTIVFTPATASYTSTSTTLTFRVN